MRIWAWVYAAVGWTLCATLSVLALRAAPLPEDLPRMLQGPLEALGRASATSFWFLGTGLAAATALAPALLLRNWRAQRQLDFSAELGRVQVDVSGLEECLRKFLVEQEGVLRARAELFIKRNPRGSRTARTCRATVWVEAGPDVLGRARHMQERLLEYYSRMLPGSEAVKVHVRTRLVYRRNEARKPPPGGEPGRAERGPGDYFDGPQYPVDGGVAGAGV